MSFDSHSDADPDASRLLRGPSSLSSSRPSSSGSNRPSTRGSSRPASSSSSTASSSSHPAGSSSSTASKYVTTNRYRTVNLAAAGIIINEVVEQWPRHVQSFISTLTDNLESEALAALGMAGPSSLAHPLRENATTLAKDAMRYALSSQSSWMDYHKRLLDVLSHDSIRRVADQRFDAEVGPTAEAGQYLSIPVPDLTFGLVTTVHRPGQPDRPLDLSFLESLMTTRGIRALPSRSAASNVPAFPCIVFEAVSQYRSVFGAENQIANGAAKSLAMVQTLTDTYNQIVGVQTSPELPTIGICSQGSYYKVFVVFDLRSASQTSCDGDEAFLHPGIHLIQIWAEDVVKAISMMQLQLLLQRISRWIHSTWRPTITGMLSTIQADIADSPSPSIE